MRQFERHIPSLDPKSFVADTAVVIGQVTVKEYGSIWFNTVARGDINRIVIGRYSNVQDGCVRMSPTNALPSLVILYL